MASTPYARLLLSIDGGAATAGGVEAAAEASVQLVYESTAGWPATPAPYAEIFEYPEGWTPDPIVGWVVTEVEQPSGATASFWRYYGSTPPPAFAAPALATWGKIGLQLVVGGGRKAGVLSTDMVSGAAVLVRSAEGLEGPGWRETTEFGDWRQWVASIQKDLRVISTALGAVSTVNAGAGLTKTGSTIDIVAADSTLTVGADNIKVATGGITDTQVNASAAIAGSKISPDFGAQNVTTTGSVSAGANGLIAPKWDRADAGALTLGGTNATSIACSALGLTGCPSVANVAGDITCTPKSDSALVGRKDALTTTYSSCVVARNATAATSIATVQNGPVVCSEGSGWRTSSGGASITVRGGIMAVPVSGSTVAARVYTVYDVGSGYSLGDYCTNSDPYLFGSARVVDTLIWTANGVRDANNGNGGIRNNSSNIQLTSGSTNEVQLATNSTVRHAITSTGAVTQSLNATATCTREFGTAGVRYIRVASKVVTTTDATATAAFTFAMADNSAVKWEVDVYCYQTGAPNLRAYLARYAGFQRNGGAPVKDFEVNKHADQVINSGGAWGTPPAVAITESNPTTNDVSVIVTGLAATSIKWAVDIKIQVTTTSA